MQEQTKIAVLLIAVITIAALSLVFIFYQYSKLQSHVNVRVIDQTAVRSVDNTPFFVQAPQDPRQSCKKPDCYYGSSYRIGAEIIETGTTDINGNNILGCHAEKIEILVQGKNPQKLKCIAGGWTLA